MSSDIRANPDQYGVRTLLAYICKEHVEEYFGNVSGPLKILPDKVKENKRLDLLAEEFNRFIDLNPDRTGAFLHCILSLQPGEDPTLEEWKQIYEKFFNKMGLGGKPFVAYLHRDTKVVHGHALVLREDTDFSFDRHRGQAICREIEQEMGLTPVLSGWERGEQRALPDSLGRRKFEASQNPDMTMSVVKLVELRNQVEQVIQDYVHEATQKPLRMSVLIERLAAKDVQADVTICDGEPGIRYGMQFDEVPFRVQGRQLGPAYTFNGLQEFKGLMLDALTAEPVQRSRSPVTRQQDAVKTYLRNVIDLTLQGNPTLPQWLQLLSEWKVKVSLRYPQSADQEQAAAPTAIRYSLEGVDRSFSGTELGGQYTFKGLRKRGLQYSLDELAVVQAAIKPWDRPVDAADAELSNSEAKRALRSLLEAPLALGMTEPLTLQEYLSRLQGHGVGIKVGWRQRQPARLTFYYEGYRFPSSQMAEGDRIYTVSGLLARGVSYDATQRSRIEALNQAAPKVLPNELEGLAERLAEQLAESIVLLDGDQPLLRGGTARRIQFQRKEDLRDRIDAAIADVYRPVIDALDQFDTVLASSQASLDIRQMQEPLVPALMALQKASRITRTTIESTDTELLPYALEQMSDKANELPKLPTYSLHQAQKTQIVEALLKRLANVITRSKEVTISSFADALAMRKVDFMAVAFGQPRSGELAKIRGFKFRRFEDTDAFAAEKLGVADKGYTPSALVRRHGIGFGHARQLELEEQSKLLSVGRLVGPESSEPKQHSFASSIPVLVTVDALNQILQQAWELFLLNHCYRQLENTPSETSSGLWQISLEPYTLTYDGNRDRFTIDASDRGRLVVGRVHANNAEVKVSNSQQQEHTQRITEAEQSIFKELWQTSVRRLMRDTSLSNDDLFNTVKQAATQVKQVFRKSALKLVSVPKKQLSLLDD